MEIHDHDATHKHSGCTCVLQAHARVFPVCASFNPNHPMEEHRGVACGTRLGQRQYCGHSKECHQQSGQEQKK